MSRIAVLCWEESRPWVSALRQKGYSVPWVEEPKGDVHKQIPAIEPDLLLVDMTRAATIDRAKQMLTILADQGHLKDVPVLLVSVSTSVTHGLKGKLDHLSVTPPTKIISAVKTALK